VLPSEWPDGGHDSDFGAIAFVTTDERVNPDDPRFLTGVPTPLAVTFQTPIAELAVTTGIVATPVASVTTTSDGAPANVPLAPLAGTENVTPNPAMGLSKASATRTDGALAKAVFTVAVCAPTSRSR